MTCKFISVWCTLQDANDAMVSADIGTGLTARNLADMRAYISLANFTCALLPLCGPSMFKGWSYLMTLELVSASGQHPLLSGFYRMLKVTMTLTAASGLLQVEGENHTMHAGDIIIHTIL